MLVGLMMLAQLPAAAGHAAERPIVVTAQSARATGRTLDACVARKCPPAEDIEASLAHAETLFVAGDYVAARATLTASRRRNARFAKTLPLEVAGLSRANARMASVVGLPDVSRINAIETVEALRAGLPADDPRILAERLTIGDSYARQGRLVAATDVYKDVAEKARRGRHFIVEGNALFRNAAAYGAVATRDAQYRDAAKHAVEAIARTTEPELAPFRDGIALLDARLASLDGDREALDRAIARVRASATTRPMLLDAPPMDPDERSVDRDFFMSGSAKAQWADVSFWIAPDGAVRDIVVLRQSTPFDSSWLDRATSALAKRRYARLATDPASPGIARVERFSYVYDVASVTPTRIRQRSPRGRLDIVDLTLDPVPPSATTPIG